VTPDVSASSCSDVPVGPDSAETKAPDNRRLGEFTRLVANEDADIREGMRAHRREPWCPDHGYGCEPSDCRCGHTLRCDCRDIADEH